jgi:Concanavalin A-like lectin/glucanases superfamily/Domain of unknown function (DUF2341)
MTWYDTNYQYKKLITIDHTKVSGSSDLTSFPVLISRVDGDLATVANSGKVQNSSGFDIIFTDSTEATKLDHEIEQYVASTGEIEMWVRIPTLSHTADTLIYMYFDNSTISTSQENITGVWDSNFVAVYHMKETAGTSSSIKDSTSNANSGTPYTNFGGSTVGNIATSSGQIAGAQSFNGSNHNIEAATSTSLNISGYLTMSAWVKRAASNTTGTLLQHGHGGVGGYVMEIGVSPASTNQVKLTKFGVADIATGSFPADSNFHHLVGSGDASGTYAYIDGSLSGTDGNTSTWNGNAATLEIGGFVASGDNAASFWNGIIDEVRISKTTRSAGWVGTEYNSQSSPSSFYSVGTLTAQSTATTIIDQAVSLAEVISLQGADLISESVSVAESLTQAGTDQLTETTQLIEVIASSGSMQFVDVSSAVELLALAGALQVVTESIQVFEVVTFVGILQLTEIAHLVEIITLAGAFILPDDAVLLSERVVLLVPSTEPPVPFTLIYPGSKFTLTYPNSKFDTTMQ